MHSADRSRSISARAHPATWRNGEPHVPGAPLSHFTDRGREKQRNRETERKCVSQGLYCVDETAHHPSAEIMSLLEAPLEQASCQPSPPALPVEANFLSLVDGNNAVTEAITRSGEENMVVVALARAALMTERAAFMKEVEDAAEAAVEAEVEDAAVEAEVEDAAVEAEVEDAAAEAVLTVAKRKMP